MAEQLEINEFDVEFYFNSNRPSVCTETENCPTLNSEGNFDLFLVEAVDEGLAILGMPARNALYGKLERNFGIEKKLIPEHFDRFLDIMYMVLGLGVRHLEARILKILKKKLEIKDNLRCNHSFVWISQDSFKESVECLREKYRSQFAD